MNEPQNYVKLSEGLKRTMGYSYKWVIALKTIDYIENAKL